MVRSNSSSTLAKLTKILKIPVTLKSLEVELQKHPNNNTLLALSDVLTNFNVPNGAYQVATEKLTEVPLPFIACMASQEFLLVTKIEKESVTVSNENWTDQVLNLDIFKMFDLKYDFADKPIVPCLQQKRVAFRELKCLIR